MGVFGGAVKRDRRETSAVFGSALGVLAFCGIAGSGAEAAVVELSAGAFATTTIVAIHDEDGRRLDGPVGTYFRTGMSGSELAQGDFLFVSDTDGNDRYSSSTVTSDFGPGWSSASFLDPALIYGGDVFGGVALFESYRNTFGAGLYAEIELRYDLSAMVDVFAARGAGRAFASLLAEGQVWRTGGFSTVLEREVSAIQSGPGSALDGVAGTEVYSVFFEPGDYMEWALLNDTGVSGSYAPIPVPGALPLLAGGLGLLAVAKRRSRQLPEAGRPRAAGPSR